MESRAKSPIRVLVVEDSLNDQELLHHQLLKTPLGDHVLFFTDPRKALSALRDPDATSLREGLVALFIDVNLPHMNGIELLRRIRPLEGMGHVPVIVMTTDPHPDTLAACKELNVAYFAEKPVTFTHFSKVLADLFYRHQAVHA